MDGMSAEAVAAMLIAGLGVLGGVVSYLFKLLYDQSRKHLAEQAERYEAQLGEKNAEITRLREERDAARGVKQDG